MTKWILFVFLSILAFDASGQGKKSQLLIDSLRQALPKLPNDQKKLNALNSLSYEMRRVNPDTGFYYANQALVLAQNLGLKAEEAEAFRMAGINLYRLGEYLKALEYHQKASKLFEDVGNKKGLAANLNNIGNIYLAQAKLPTALSYYQKALPLNESMGNLQEVANNLNNIGNIHYSTGDYQAALENYLKVQPVYEKLGNQANSALSLGNIGSVYHRLGDFPRALGYFQKALAIYEKIGNESGQADCFNNIGNIYLELKDFKEALSYFQKALLICERVEDKSGQAINLGSIGTVYFNLSNDKKALEYHERSLAIYEKMGNQEGVAVNLANTALVYKRQGDIQRSLDYFQRALSINEATGNKYGQAAALNNIGENYTALSNFSLAMSSQMRALKIAQESKDQYIEQSVWNQLSIIHEKQGHYVEAYNAYKNYITLRDSVQGQAVKKEITRREIQFEFDKKEATYQLNQRLTEEQLQKQSLLAKQRSQQLLLSSQQLALSNKEKDLQRLAFLKEQAEKQEKEKQLSLVQKEKQLQAAQLTTLSQQAALQKATIRSRQLERNILIVGASLLLLALFFIYRNFSNQRKSNRLISAEKQKSDNLLLNILPSEVASELKDKGSATARQFDNVTVLFTDFVKFTTISETLSPTALVAEIDHCFRAFDAIIEKYELEKIKTIGDAYLAVSGLPLTDPQHAQKAIMAAREICNWVSDPRNGSKFEIRIGLNSGPVVAGIVGVKKFAYDIWGDTVNTAARMEQNSEAGKINISGSTYHLVKDDFAFIHRGKIEAKNKGAIDMYFLEA